MTERPLTRQHTRKIFLVLIGVMCLSSARVSAQQTSVNDIVLYASEATTRSGGWVTQADATAAGGARIYHPNANAAKISPALAAPTHYFEMTFQAEANRAYRLWIRGKSEGNHWGNDSVWVQFSGSVTNSGSPVYRIGTTSGTDVNIEDCGDCGLSEWGWQDNIWNSTQLGPPIYFATTGPQTIRVQAREDGISIDQILLSPDTYLNASPGQLKNDTVILPKTAAADTSEIVIHASDVPDERIVGFWEKVDDSSAAGGKAMRNIDASMNVPAKVDASAEPFDYFEVTFSAKANTPYHLWLRTKAAGNSGSADSLYVQFSESLNAPGGTPIYKIGTASAASVILEDCTGCGRSGWGWQDDKFAGLAAPIYFARTGPQTIRVQAREDGIIVDQIVLSSQTYFSTSPGALKDDTVILGKKLVLPTSPPQASINASTTSGLGPLTVNFTASVTAPRGIASYQWNFGNNQVSTAAAPSFTYQAAGTYNVRLIVTDNGGATVWAKTQVIVTNRTGADHIAFKVLSWNIYKGQGTDDDENLERTAQWIFQLAPDAAALCEVMRYTSRDQTQILSYKLRAKTGLPWYGYWVSKEPGDTEGNFIFSRFPLPVEFRNPLYYSDGNRSAAQARVNLGGGKFVNLFATHLEVDTSTVNNAPLRAQEIAQLLNWANNFPEPKIIAGDFNARPDDSEIQTMTGTFFDAWKEALAIPGAATAYPDNAVGPNTRTQRYRIDYICYSRNATGFTLKSAQVPDSRDLSDTGVVKKVGTLDDKGVRPSDHNHLLVTFELQ